MRVTGESRESSHRLLLVLWSVLALLLLCLVGVATVLLVRMDFFSGSKPTDQEIKSIWAFVGVALGAVVTLIGALLTEQHNRRTVALTREAAEREKLARDAQQALDAQTQQRLSLDTVGKLLELITKEDGEYAKPARVGGAIATMIELEGGAVALRILGDLWSTGAVDTPLALWLLERVLENPKSTESEQIQAAYLLNLNASRLVPSPDDDNQDWRATISVLDGPWPSHLPGPVQDALGLTMINMLLARDLSYWKERGDAYPVQVLMRSLQGEYAEALAYVRAYVLKALLDLRVLNALDAEPDEREEERIRSLSDLAAPAPWFAQLVSQFKPWAAGQSVVEVAQSVSPRAPIETRPDSPEGGSADQNQT
jgi:UPF0716 family protein affecting phage T7 exclusion